MACMYVCRSDRLIEGQNPGHRSIQFPSISDAPGRGDKNLHQRMVAFFLQEGSIWRIILCFLARMNCVERSSSPEEGFSASEMRAEIEILHAAETRRVETSTCQV